MTEACGACSRSFLPNRKINESLKCACERSFFSQIVTCDNVPSDQDCWIEVPKRFVRHHSSQFGKTVSFEGDDGLSYPCRLVGSKMAEVGYGFEWYEFASAHNVSLEDQVVLTLMENSRFLVQVYRAHGKVKVEPVEQDVDVQVAGAQDWLRAKVRRSVTNTVTDSAPLVDSMPGSEGPLNKEHQVPMGQKKKLTARMSLTSSPPQPQVPDDCLESDAETETDGEASSSSTSDSDWSLDHKVLDNKKPRSEPEKDAVEDDSESTSDSTSADNMTEEEELRISSSRIMRGVYIASGDEDKCTQSPLLHVAPRVITNHQFSKPGTTVKRTYASKRRPVTCADRNKAFEAARACPVTHSSFLRTLEKATCYRALSMVIPAPWFREYMPETDRAYDATVVDDEGKSWKVRIRGIEIYWRDFSLDHYLEEGDVVVMELVDTRLESLKFLVHIFRVVDVQVTVTGKPGWAMHYNIVEGRNKRKKQEAHSKRKPGRVKKKHAHDESSSIAETSHRRLTRRQAVVEEDTEEEEEEEEEVSDKDPISSDLMEVKMDYARESTDGGPKTVPMVMSRKVKVETE